MRRVRAELGGPFIYNRLGWLLVGVVLGLALANYAPHFAGVFEPGT